MDVLGGLSSDEAAHIAQGDQVDTGSAGRRRWTRVSRRLDLQWGRAAAQSNGAGLLLGRPADRHSAGANKGPDGENIPKSSVTRQAALASSAAPWQGERGGWGKWCAASDASRRGRFSLCRRSARRGPQQSSGESKRIIGETRRGRTAQREPCRSAGLQARGTKGVAAAATEGGGGAVRERLAPTERTEQQNEQNVQKWLATGTTDSAVHRGQRQEKQRTENRTERLAASWGRWLSGARQGAAPRQVLAQWGLRASAPVSRNE
ncbi:uncharacterized protein BJ171DRAFT_473598 [Polychytrium aggregatum]|uniref:uncharacterized protein n=1 Tax=Polychytrium aggregatum TaxID=110093 RepID=UPI0022FE42C5|nr:uncharacterized protein BJ171DRAFT_473598 [Polychytrium aggregatum]KAI9206074.1 hypothetical protein BJ171DRAFT_473598 [Polychytrium aggregatum]